MKRKLSFVLAMVILALCFTGCGSNNDVAENGETVIYVGGCPVKEQAPELWEQFEAQRLGFMEKYPEIKVIGDEYNYSMDTYLSKAAANQLPTIYYLPFTEVDKVMEAGYVADVTEYMEKYGYMESMRSDVLEKATRDGKVWMVPIKTYYLGMTANKEVLAQAGMLDEDGYVVWPKTFDELGQMAGEIKAKTGIPGFVMPTMKNVGGWHFMNIAWSYGATFMEKQGEQWVATFNSPECAEALQFVKDLQWKYNALSDNLFIDFAEGRKMIATNQGAFHFAVLDDNLFKPLVMQNGMDRNSIAMGKIPAGPEGQYGLLGGSMMAISSTATPAQIDACFKWLDYVGNGPKMSDEEKQVYEQSILDRLEIGMPVLPKNCFNVWKSGEKVEAQDAILAKYTDMDERNLEDYYDTEGMIIKAEEPICCQELYIILDSCIQEVISNKDADVNALLAKAANDFQVNYLDNVK
ncbi:MAG: extracellular solute-binding protein [Clostridia bacterium]|nr:extracellular solute-binding protein [Clostridia bacterium]